MGLLRFGESRCCALTRACRVTAGGELLDDGRQRHGVVSSPLLFRTISPQYSLVLRMARMRILEPAKGDGCTPSHITVVTCPHSDPANTTDNCTVYDTNSNASSSRRSLLLPASQPHPLQPPQSARIPSHQARISIFPIGTLSAGLRVQILLIALQALPPFAVG
jgi:hypothetical protein